MNSHVLREKGIGKTVLLLLLQGNSLSLTHQHTNFFPDNALSLTCIGAFASSSTVWGRKETDLFLLKKGGNCI